MQLMSVYSRAGGNFFRVDRSLEAKKNLEKTFRVMRHIWSGRVALALGYAPTKASP
jgi:hypothetical protein